MNKIIAVLGFCGIVLSPSLSAVNDYEVTNGFSGMNRDIILRLVVLTKDNVLNVKNIMGMCQEHYQWKNHNYFNVGYKQPLVLDGYKALLLDRVRQRPLLCRLSNLQEQMDSINLNNWLTVGQHLMTTTDLCRWDESNVVREVFSDFKTDDRSFFVLKALLPTIAQYTFGRYLDSFFFEHCIGHTCSCSKNGQRLYDYCLGQTYIYDGNTRQLLGIIGVIVEKRALLLPWHFILYLSGGARAGKEEYKKLLKMAIKKESDYFLVELAKGNEIVETSLDNWLRDSELSSVVNVLIEAGAKTGYELTKEFRAKNGEGKKIKTKRGRRPQ